MNEHETRLEKRLRHVGRTCGPVTEHELRAALSAARDAALEEAVAAVDAERLEDTALARVSGARQRDELTRRAERHASVALRIRALKSRPAERYLFEAEVREVAATLLAPVVPGALNPDWERGFDAGVEALAGRLDAAPASSTCTACGHAFHDDNACAACRPGECIRSDS